MDWQTMDGVEVGTNRFASGRWCIVEDEIEVRLEVESNGETEIFTVTPNTPSENYATLARYAIQRLNAEDWQDISYETLAEHAADNTNVAAWQALGRSGDIANAEGEPQIQCDSSGHVYRVRDRKHGGPWETFR